MPDAVRNRRWADIRISPADIFILESPESRWCAGDRPRAAPRGKFEVGRETRGAPVE